MIYMFTIQPQTWPRKQCVPVHINIMGHHTEKCALLCCDKCPIIIIISQEANKYTTNTCPTIRFHVYLNVSCCTLHGRRPYKQRTKRSMCSTVPRSDMSENVYTRKQMVLLETTIIEFYEKFSIPAIKKLYFYFPHVRIIGTHHRGKECREEFKLWGNIHEVLCCSDYAEWIVSSFTHQIQSKQYVGNMYVSIEGI